MRQAVVARIVQAPPALFEPLPLFRGDRAGQRGVLFVDVQGRAMEQGPGGLAALSMEDGQRFSQRGEDRRGGGFAADFFAGFVMEGQPSAVPEVLPRVFRSGRDVLQGGARLCRIVDYACKDAGGFAIGETIENVFFIVEPDDSFREMKPACRVKDFGSAGQQVR